MFTFLIVIVGTAGQLIINKLLGNTFNGNLFGAQLGSFLPLLILGPLSEEIGWRGYALGKTSDAVECVDFVLDCRFGLGIVASTVVYDGGHFSA